MIQQQSILRIVDNSGAKTAKCIKVLKKKNRSKNWRFNYSFNYKSYQKLHE